jgi:hypothetical protein
MRDWQADREVLNNPGIKDFKEDSEGWQKLYHQVYQYFLIANDWLNSYKELETESASRIARLEQQKSELKQQLAKAEAVIKVAEDTCEELEGHKLYAIRALRLAVDIYGEK